MAPTPQIYLTFDGRCEGAFSFYEQRLGAKIGSLNRYGNSPMAASVPAGWETKIMHGSITLGALAIAGVDLQPGQYVEPAGFHIFLEGEDAAETERLFTALTENARIDMPLQETFWTQRFGILTDQFGIPWTFNCAQAPDAAT
jgi:PhnB protein